MNYQNDVTKELKKIKEDKYNELIEELKTKEQKKKLHAIEELVQLGDERAAEPLADLLEEELCKIDYLPPLERLDKYLQYNGEGKGEMIIEKIDQAIIKVASWLFDYLDVGWEMDMMAMYTLEKLGNRKEEKAIDTIIEIIELEPHEDEMRGSLRYPAMLALGQIGGMKVETLLVEYALKEEEDQDRCGEAVTVLGLWGGEYTAEKMQDVLESETDCYMFLKQHAIEILGKINHPRSIEVLEKTLKKTSVYEERREINRSIRRLRREEQKAHEK